MTLYGLQVRTLDELASASHPMATQQGFHDFLGAPANGHIVPRDALGPAFGYGIDMISSKHREGEAVKERDESSVFFFVLEWVRTICPCDMWGATGASESTRKRASN